MADKPEMTLERVAARIRHLLHHNHDPLDRIGIYNCESCDGVRKILEEAEQAARRAALSTPRITREQAENVWRQIHTEHLPGFMEALRELGIAVDPPTEADNRR